MALNIGTCSLEFFLPKNLSLVTLKLTPFKQKYYYWYYSLDTLHAGEYDAKLFLSSTVAGMTSCKSHYIYGHNCILKTSVLILFQEKKT